MNTLAQRAGPLAEIVKYRQRIVRGVIQDVRHRYLGSVLGVAWVFVFPLLQLGIFATIYAVIFQIRVPGLTEAGYVLLVFSGLVPLLAFGESLTASLSSLSASRTLLLNNLFPAHLLAVRSVLAAQLPALVGVVVTLSLGLWIGRTGWEALVLVPIFWMLLMMFVIGLGWIISLVSLVARDLNHGIGLVVMVMFFMSPFAYTPEMVPSALKALIYFNPMSYFVLTFQQLICYGKLPDPEVAFGAAFLGLSSFFLGYTFFQRTKSVFLDHV